MSGIISETMVEVDGILVISGDATGGEPNDLCVTPRKRINNCGTVCSIMVKPSVNLFESTYGP